ncbi:hypothetical protein CWO85_01910 [Candidatus Phytoplasma ziziphi]|uniref:Uncharacterized protein n=1 Tax=Ziziphus jujuba witches'-broom phytoplasma TaxID=135727 RepID=A0A660HNC9_ZIZJU|nr:hypothetical protein [Candidatus Phytoplasma ziziphi]AYJ01276.1 hypothetical protein CWO85_01910 [Candidatus Phytoplasma ziziphi]
MDWNLPNWFNCDNFRFFISFFAGLISGFIFFSLVYLFSILRNFNKNIYQTENKNDKLSNEDMNELIKEKQAIFKQDIKKKPDDYISSLLFNCKNLILEVSSTFYPKSEFPYLELNIKESLALIQYVHDRLDSLFNKKIIFYFKKMTLKQIFVLKQKLVDKKYVQKYRKTRKIYNIFSNTLNLLNPFHWVKTTFMKIFYDKIIIKIGCSIITIMGEEIYQVYSKKIFETQNIDDILNELEKDIINTKEELLK